MTFDCRSAQLASFFRRMLKTKLFNAGTVLYCKPEHCD